MDRASTLAYPGSRALAGWWRQLQPYQPRSLWTGFLFVHRVEALVLRADPRSVDPLALLALRALNLIRSDAAHVDGLGEPTALEPLADRLHLPASALTNVVSGLEQQGFAERHANGWRLSERGKQVLAEGRYVPTRPIREVFPFVERLASTGQRVLPPHFLPLAETSALVWLVGDATPFRLSFLQECIAQSPQWKERFGFPAEVRDVIDGPTADAWQQVVLDRPEQLCVVLIATERELLAFAVQLQGWNLDERVPILRLSEAAREALPDLAPTPLEAWREAWLLWCRQRNLPSTEVEMCRLNADGPRLIVEAPGRLVQRLRAANSDALRNEAWLLAGEGYLRTGALLQLI